MNAAPRSPQDLSLFDNRDFERGAGAVKEGLWLLVREVLFLNGFLRCFALKRGVLRAFGASVGRGVIIKPGVRISFPWRLTLGDHVWLGEEVAILSLAPVSIGSHAAVSQRAFLCTGNHDWSDPAFRLRAEPIVIEGGSWIAAGVFVAPGVTVGHHAVATAGSVVTGDLPADSVCSGNPCVKVAVRKTRDAPPV